MPIKLNGSSSGFTQIDAASVAGNNTLTLPTASGTLMTTGGTNTFTANQVIEVTDNTNAALRITQLGTGNALLVEDSANPDSSPFVVDANGNVGIGTTAPGAPLEVKGTNDPLLNLNNTGTGSNAIWLSRSGTLHTALYTDNAGASYLRNFQSQPMSFWTNNAERMRVNSGGLVGIGTDSPGTKLEVSGAGFGGGAATFRSTNSGNGISVIGVNGAGINDSAYISFQDGTASRDCFIGLTGDAATAGALRFATGGSSERMRIDSSGNVGIGTASPSARLDVRGGNGTGGISGPTSGTWASRIVMNQDTSGYSGLSVHSRWADGTTPVFEVASGWNGSAAGYYPVYTVNGTGLAVWKQNSGTERMRLTADGKLCVGITSAAITNSESFYYFNGSGSHIVVQHSNSAVSGNWYVGFTYNGDPIGAIVQNGTTGVTYNTTSDYRLKENVAPISGASERVMALKPSRFNFKSEPNRTVDGFLAHEAQSVVPEAVTGEKDAVELVDIKDDDGNITGQEERPVYQGIDQSKLVPLLTAALQEALTKIDALETRIAALESA